ncbi:MAG: LysR family transcriptional regulator [Pseudomonadota bacterium]
MTRPPAPSSSLDVDVMKSVTAIAEAGSIAAAATRVGRTPAAVSMQIKKLEEMLGRTLFDRTRQGMTPTAEGERLLIYARQMLELNRAAMHAFSTPELTGEVTIGLIDSFGGVRLAKVLSSFARSHPKVTVNVTMDQTSALGPALDRGEKDLILFTPGCSETLRPTDCVLAEEPLVWIMKEGGRAHRQSPIPLAVASEGCAWRKLSTDAIEAAGLDARIAYVADFDHAQIAAAEADLAVAPMPKSYLRPGLTALGSRDGFPPLGIGRVALRLSERAGPAVHALASDIAATYCVSLDP